MQRTAWLNGNIVPLEDARVSVMDRGFLFADGIYEVTAVLDGKLIDSARHLARLERSAAAIGLTLAYTSDQIEAAERDLIARNQVDQGSVYLQLTAGAAERDFVRQPDTAPTLVMFTQTYNYLDSPAAQNGVAVITLPDIRWARRDIKSVMLLAQVLAKQAAKTAGVHEAWMVQDGFVTEGASSTALIVTRDGTLVTRPYSQTVLPGCTRAAIWALAEQDGVKIEERPFTVEEAQGAREAMLTSATTFVTPVVSIDGRPVGDGTPGPIAKRLRQLYIEAARAD